LDEVVTPDGWQDEYREITNGSEHGLICRLGVRYAKPADANGFESWTWKEDGAGFSDVESIKGGFSDALKRAAVKFGMGRFLYDLIEVYVSGEQIKDGYAPKSVTSVSIYSKADSIRGWCMAPKVSEIMKAPVKTFDVGKPSVANDNRQAIESDIGRLASMIGADALTAARDQLTNLRDMVKSKGITPEEYITKLKAFKDELETKVAGAV